MVEVQKLNQAENQHQSTDSSRRYGNTVEWDAQEGKGSDAQCGIYQDCHDFHLSAPVLCCSAGRVDGFFNALEPIVEHFVAMPEQIYRIGDVSNVFVDIGDILL